MKKVILISLVIFFGCGDKDKSSDKESVKTKKLVGAYIFERPLEPSVFIFNSDNSMIVHKLEKSGWLSSNFKWNIKDNQLCFDNFKRDVRCMDYELSGDKLLIYDNPDNSPDIAKKIQ